MLIEVPGIGQVEFPDTMSEAEVVAAIEELLAAPPPVRSPTTGLEAVVAGVGRGAWSIPALLSETPQGKAMRWYNERVWGIPNRPADYPAAVAATEAVLAKIKRQPGPYREHFERVDKAARERLAQLERERPVTTGLSAGVGGAPWAALGPAPAAGGALGARMAGYGAAAGGQSAAMQYGLDTDLPESERLKRAAVAGLTGSGIGAATGGLLPATPISPLSAYLLPKESSTLRRWAELSAARSSGADRTALRRATRGSRSRLAGVGRFMLDDPDMQLRSPLKIQERSLAVGGEVGPEIGRLAAAGDKAGVSVDLMALANAIRLSRPMQKLQSSTIGRGGYKQVSDFLDDQILRAGGEEALLAGRSVMVPASKLHQIRMLLEDAATWDRQAPTPVIDAWRSARDTVSNVLGDRMAKAGLGRPWREANAKFSFSRMLANPQTKRGMADVGVERRQGNMFLSPTEKAAGLTGLAMAGFGQGPLGVAVAGGGIVGRRWGMPMAARTFEAMSKAPSIPSVPPMSVGTSGVMGEPAVEPALAALLAKLRERRKEPSEEE